MTPLARLLARAALPIRRRWLARRLGRLVCETVEGLPLVVLPDVFNPALFGSSDQLLRALRDHAARETTRGRVLDMGTGSGVGAVAAALLGFHVTAVDINPAAVRCARMNVLLHDLEGRVHVREGDLFDAVPGERFDLVLFNPPFFDGIPRSPADRAWRSVDVPERFASGLPGALVAGGRALIVVSSHGGRDRAETALARAGLEVSPVAVADLGYEVVTIVEARPVGPRT